VKTSISFPVNYIYNYNSVIIIINETLTNKQTITRLTLHTGIIIININTWSVHRYIQANVGEERERETT
jgi:hypothetical protein